MICIASIDKNIIDSLLRDLTINENLSQFFERIADDYEKSNHIRIADNNSSFIKRSLKTFAKKTDNLKISEILTELLNFHDNFDIKIFLSSFTNNLGVESKYVDFSISGKNDSKKKLINVDDSQFKKKVKEYENKIQNNLISIDDNLDGDLFEKEIQKIFLNSSRCNLLRTSMAKDTLPFKPNENDILNFKEIKPSSNDFKNAINTLYFFINCIIKIKKEGIFLHKNSPIELNIFSYFLRDNRYKEIFYNKEDAEKLLCKNLSQDRFLKRILEEYKINLKFCYFCLFKPGEESRTTKNLIHLRHLSTSNGSFKIDYENLAQTEFSSSNNEINIKNIEVFEISKSKLNKDSSINSIIFKNSLNLEILEANFP